MRATTEAEIRRMEREHQEDHLRHRQAVYHDFLDAHRQLDNFATGNADTVDVAELRLRFNHAANAVVLFGVPDVRDAMTDLLGLYARIAAEKPDRETIDELRVRIAALRPNFIEAADKLTHAMRADVAPEARFPT
jgi:hypothetical protein